MIAARFRPNTELYSGNRSAIHSRMPLSHPSKASKTEITCSLPFPTPSNPLWLQILRQRLMAQASLRLSPPQASTYSEIVPSRTEMLYNPQAISEPVHSSVYPKSSGCIPPPWTTNAFTVRGFHLQRRKFSLHNLRVASRNEFRQNFIKAFR